MGLRELFADPPARCRQAPLWAWNANLDPDDLDWQISQMEEKGLGGFVIEARPGLTVPFQSAPWYERVAQCCAKAARLGMLAWLSDAACGADAGRLKPMQRIRWVAEEVIGPSQISWEGNTLAAYAGASEDALTRIDGPPWEAPAGTSILARVLVEPVRDINGGAPPVDALDPEAAEALVEERYASWGRALGDLTEAGITGFFTQNRSLAGDMDELAALPWTETLPDRFQERNGYDMRDHLPALFRDREGGRQVRYDFWDTVTALFLDNRVVAPTNWCSQNGLQWTGCPVRKEALLLQSREIGSLPRLTEGMGRPGVLQEIAPEEGFSTASLLTRSAVSLAASKGEPILSGVYRGAGWGLTPWDMRSLADWELLNGAGYLMPFTLHYSIGGNRKRDVPPSLFYQSPFWPHYRVFADYTARLTALFEGGRPVCDVALLYPGTPFWTEHVPGDHVAEELLEAEAAWNHIGLELRRQHRGFIVVSEDDLAGTDTAKGPVLMADTPCRALIIPPMPVMRADVLEALRRLAPTVTVVVTGGKDVSILHPGRAPETQLETVDLGEIMPDAVFIDALAEDGLTRALASVETDMCIEGLGAEEVYCSHLRRDHLELFFFVNTAPDEARVVATVGCIGRAEVWDAESGAISDFPDQERRKDGMALPFVLAGQSSMVVVVDPHKEPAEVARVEFAPTQRMKLCELWHFTPHNGNFLRLADWQFNLAQEHDTLALSYRTQFVLSEPIANVRLFLDNLPEAGEGFPALLEVLLNGETLCEHCFWEMDVGMQVLEIAPRLDAGVYQLVIEMRDHRMGPYRPCVNEYMWLAGDFALDLSGGVPRLSAVRGIHVGPWEEQGFPYFSGTASYMADLSLPEELAQKRVMLNAGRVGHVLKLEVNGRDQGTRAWPPYRYDISGLVNRDTNLFVLDVSNTLRNFIQNPEPEFPSGLLDEVYLEFV